MDPAVELVGVSKGFGQGEQPAVSELSLAVTPGEVVTLLGPSGSGKTTLLRLVAGFLTPDGGLVRLGGREVAGPHLTIPPERRGVGMVFQDYALFPHLTVFKNVAFGLISLPRIARNKAVSEALDLVGLRGLEHRYPHELSGGQQQRVALARAIAPQPIVILLDEPFSSLDASLRAQVRDDVATILHESGASALFVTHDQDEALFMGDRVGVLRAGRLEQAATPEDIYHSPASRFVAEFMGKTDFLPGEVTTRGVRTELGLLPQRLQSPPGAEVQVAFRPDDVRIVPDLSSDARVVMRHFEGAAAVYHVALPSGGVVHSLQPHTLVLEPGTPVAVFADAGHDLPCFDREGLAVPLHSPLSGTRLAFSAAPQQPKYRENSEEESHPKQNQGKIDHPAEREELAQKEESSAQALNSHLHLAEHVSLRQVTPRPSQPEARPQNYARKLHGQGDHHYLDDQVLPAEQGQGNPYQQLIGQRIDHDPEISHLIPSPSNGPIQEVGGGGDHKDSEAPAAPV